MPRVHERAVRTVPRLAHLLLSSLPNVNPPLLSPHPFQIYVNDTLITNIPDELAGMHSLQVRRWLLLRVVTVFVSFVVRVLQLLVLSQGAISDGRLRELRRKILGRKVMFV